jgi:hypothetical protein
MELRFPAVSTLHPDVQEFMEEIVHAMVTLFGISQEEAIGRVVRQWSHVAEFGEPVPSGVSHVDTPSLAILLMREEPAYWAKDIYFGHDSGWWNDEEGIRAAPVSLRILSTPTETLGVQMDDDKLGG